MESNKREYLTTTKYKITVNDPYGRLELMNYLTDTLTQREVTFTIRYGVIITQSPIYGGVRRVIQETLKPWQNLHPEYVFTPTQFDDGLGYRIMKLGHKGNDNKEVGQVKYIEINKVTEKKYAL